MSVSDAIDAVTEPEVVDALQESWAVISADRRKNGVQIMINLFETSPETVEIFKRLGDVSTANAWQNRKLKGHGTTLMYGIQSFVDQLDDKETMEDVGRKFAVNHLKRGVTSKEFQLITEPLLQFLSDTMGDGCTDAVKDGWRKLVGAILAILDDEKATMA